MTWTYQPRHEVTACNLCSSPRSEWLHLADRDRAGHQATSVICRNCGLVFLTPRMTAEGYAEFYGSGEYRRTVERMTGNPTDWERLRRSQAQYAHVVGEWLAPRLPCDSLEVGTLLDIGGSTGIIAEELCRRFKLHGTVLEPCVEELAEAATRGLTTELGSLETWDPGERKFGLITIWQSVDHLLDIAGSLAKLRNLLAPGGLFAVDIVNFPYLVKGFRNVEQAVKIDHCFGLSPSVMVCFLLRAGFEIIEWPPRLGLGGRKVFFLCRHGEPKNVLPEQKSVDYLIKLVEEVRYAKA